MKLYTALDVSLRSVAICVVNEQGEVQYEANVVAEVQRIVTCLRSFSAERKVVGFEAVTLMQY
jgi:transposase